MESQGGSENLTLAPLLQLQDRLFAEKASFSLYQAFQLLAKYYPAFASIPRRKLEDTLFSEPYSFSFFQAVRLLRRYFPHGNNVGSYQPLNSEIVRFAAFPSLASPASEIQELEQRPGLPPLMRVNFMGLIGPSGLLPLYYTQLVIDRLRSREPDRKGDASLRDFLDIFHHRIISLFYRAWQKYRFQIAYEQREPDEFSGYLFSAFGLGTPGLKGRQDVADESLLGYSGLLAQQPRNAWSLELILHHYFGVPVRVEQFLGAWYRLDEDAQCNLDDSRFASQQLGSGAVVGDEIWDPQARVRIVLGPLPLDKYLDFLPSGSAYRPLSTLVRFYAGDEFDFELQLVLLRDHVPPCQLGAEGEKSPRLGWLTWAKTKEMETDPSQAIMQLSH